MNTITLIRDSLSLVSPPFNRKNWNSTIDHIPKEISWYTWYALQKSANAETEHRDFKTKTPPLINGRLEIRNKNVVVWSDNEKL